MIESSFDVIGDIHGHAASMSSEVHQGGASRGVPQRHQSLWCRRDPANYWLQGKPVISAGYAACLDDSVAKRGFLTAYRWSGETTLSPEDVVYVSA